jgi:hypothetical protein
MARSYPTSASFFSFAFGLQPLRPFQNFVLDFCFHFPEIPIISAVVSVFGKSLRKVGVIFHTPPPVNESNRDITSTVSTAYDDCDCGRLVAAGTKQSQTMRYFVRFGIAAGLICNGLLFANT